MSRGWPRPAAAAPREKRPPRLCGAAIQHGYVCVFLHQVNSRWMIHSCAFAHNYTKKLLRLKDTFYQFFYQFFGGSPSRFSRARNARAAPSGSWFAAKPPARQMCRAFVVARRDYLNPMKSWQATLERLHLISCQIFRLHLKRRRLLLENPRSPTTTVFCLDSILDARIDSISGLGQNTSPFTIHPYSNGFISIFSFIAAFLSNFSYSSQQQI